ncbi:hypothetical protein HPB48_018752 [Haemaphysalis longicornis]|uniref:Ubiquitin-like domain-containing protein n=1 Tax=Haemaphysalis longicornis TaxID=44386 RepID=A0A9J6GF06_HAELO|nr:hypothetical protein HPB48_018752 [Haemaphysalis longicornis]
MKAGSGDQQLRRLLSHSLQENIQDKYLSKHKFSYFIPKKINFGLLKEAVSKEFSAPVELLCLIFAGKILKDHEALATHNIKDGLTVHLVVRSGNSARDGSPSGVPPNPFASGGLPGLAGVNLGSGTFAEMQQRMQRELVSNPDLLRQLMENPFVQSLMSNPDYMRQLIVGNPQMQQLMERNPEINHLLNNPEMLRQTMEMVRNPSMLQELMRTQDRAISNLEATRSRVASRRVARRSHRRAGRTATRCPTRGRVAAAAPQAAAVAPRTGGSGSPAGGGLGGMFGTPGMQSVMRQLAEDPSLMQNMMSAPYMQNMLRTLASNPDMANQMLSSNPLLADNPQLQEQMRRMMPQFLQQLQNPEVQGLITNPQALQASGAAATGVVWHF